MSKKHSGRIGVIYICLAIGFFMLPSYNKSLEKKSGQFLVAAPKLQQEPFKESVLLVQQYSLASAQAVMVNKPLDEAPDGIAGALQETGIPLYYGGPVAYPHRVSLLQNKSGTLILEDISHLATVPEMLDAKLAEVEKSKQSMDTRIILGYSGWGILQLTMEALRGYWTFTEANSQGLKKVAPDDLWDVVLGSPVDISVEKTVDKVEVQVPKR